MIVPQISAKMIIFYDLENEAKNDFFNYTMLQ